MKVIEIISERNSWSTIKGYKPERMQNEFSDHDGAVKFLRGKFLSELKKLSGFLEAWKQMAETHNYPAEFTIKAKNLTNKFISVVENPNMKENLSPTNIKFVSGQLSKAALFFGSISHDFKDVGDDKLALICTKLHSLLSNAEKETKSINPAINNPVSSDEMRGKYKNRNTGIVPADELGINAA